MASGKIDVHLHLIPPFYRNAVLRGGLGGRRSAAIRNGRRRSRSTLWTGTGSQLAITSIAQPGVQFLPGGRRRRSARRCNDYAAELIASMAEAVRLLRPDPDGRRRFARSRKRAIASRRCISRASACSQAMARNSSAISVRSVAGVPRRAQGRGPRASEPASVEPGRSTLPWPGFMIEYPFDTTRAAVNLLFSGALERFPNIRFILSHAGGTLPFSRGGCRSRR